MKFYPFLTVIFIVVSCKNGSEKTSPVVENITESVYASGIVKSQNQYQVFSTVNGLIQEIFFSEGDTITKGAPLMKVLNESSQLNTYNARLAADNSDMYVNTDKLNEAKVAIGTAMSKMKDDSLLLSRQSKLWSQAIGSRFDFEQKQLAYKNSLANYQVAAIHYRELKRQLEFASKQAQTNLKISALQTGDYFIKAEASGRVYKILKEKGELVNLANPVAIIGDANNFLIEMKVDEYDISRIRQGQRVLYTMDSYKGKVFEALVDKIEPLMDEQSRSFTVKAAFVTRPMTLYPNLSVEANIVIQLKEKALTIPRSYLVGDSMVKLSNGKMRKVSIGLKDYKKVEILNGLTVSDKIMEPAK